MDQPPAPPTQPQPPTSSDRNWAMASHIGALGGVIIGGWLINIIVPLVVMLMKREDSAFATEHARESLNFQLSLTIYGILAAVGLILTLSLAAIVLVPVLLVIVVVAVIAVIQASVAASRGEQYRYPITMRLVS